VGRDELDNTDVVLHEEAGGRRWQVSPGSFFQASAEGADALVHEVGGAVDLLVARGVPTGRLVDLCAGVGLFAGTVGEGFADVVAVEPSPSAVVDARHNLDPGVEVAAATMSGWTATAADVVVADPPRAGLEAAGVATVAATGANGLVLVSCDPASLGRDARLLADAGYRLVRSRVLDLFPQTSHVEVVSTFLADAPT
jgi:23S rRNA (uracil1939-C5)-methyltransferase